jgi:coenzyme F420-reducing hydrogenase delta subunit
MSLYRHKRTKVMYRKLMDSFSVERQRHSVVYISMATGEVFDRDADKFEENFDVLVTDVQGGIIPKGTDPELPI